MTERAPDEQSKPLLGVSGHFGPLEVTKIVGLSADRTWRRGERNAKRVIPRFDFWAIEVAERHSHDVEALVGELLLRVAGYESRIAAARALGLNVELSVVAKCFLQESTSPALHLSAEQVTCLFRLGAHLDIDLYPYVPEGEEGGP